MIEFAWPYVFCLVPIPLLLYTFLAPYRANENALLKVPAISDFSRLRSFRSSSPLSKPKVFALFMIWLLLLSSAARPQWVGNPVELPRNGRDLMLAVDLSGSMQIQDFEINGRVIDRLSAIKLIAGDFIDRRRGDRIGLILFGSQAYLQAPLTFDLLTVKQLLTEAAVGLAGTETAIGDAIGLAVKQLRDRPQASRVLVLITDGMNNAGELTPEKAAELAANEQLKIHTIAIGSKQRIVQTAFGSAMSVYNGEIDEKALKAVAEKSGGNYFRAYDSRELADIYRHIDRLEKHEESGHTFRPIVEMYYWPLGIALACIGLFMSYERLRRWQR